MADVNWRKYDCDICLAVTLAGAAAASALLTVLLGSMGSGVMFQVIAFLIVWAVLGWFADGICAARAVKPVGAKDASPFGVDGSVASETRPRDAELTADAAAADEKAAAEKTAQAAKVAEEKAATEVKAAEQKAAVQAQVAAKAAATDELDRDGDGVIEGTNEGTRPEVLGGPRGGAADDLKRIKGIGPKLEQVCNALGFFHFDQIAGWTSDEVAWVDSNLEGFKGRVTRDDWVSQARLLAEGSETEFSKRVDGGDVPSSQ